MKTQKAQDVFSKILDENDPKLGKAICVRFSFVGWTSA